MNENESIKLLSERVQKEWITGCPIRVSRVCLSRRTDDDSVFAVVTALPCGDLSVKSYTVDLEYTGAKRQHVGNACAVELSLGDSAPVNVPFNDAVYAYATVRSVILEDGSIWNNESGSRGSVPPEQEIYWQTDPLYNAIRVECSGVTEARYKPDRIDGAWRCTCGHINLDTSDTCGSCGCALEWLNTHLDPEYLTKRSAEIADKTEQEAIKQRKKRDRTVSDTTKMIAIFSAIAVVAALIVLTFTTFIPLGRYNKAVALVDEGEYDRAIEIFADLGGLRDSVTRIADASYKKAQVMTGLTEVNMTTSARSPWFSITEDGVLSFKKDEYEDAGGTWEHFTVPDIVDDVIVRELDRNFFMNCSDLCAVTISDCVEVIGEQCFYNCESMTDIIFGKNVRVIMPRAFINCISLTELEIPDTVTSLGIRAFNNCIKLHKVVLGSGITEIGSYQFSMCLELERITLKSPITSVGEYAFSECTSLRKIHCRFGESEWVEPTVSADGNETFLTAERHYNAD